MRHSESHKLPIFRVCRRVGVVLFILTIFTVHLTALDFTLNGRNHAVLDSSALNAHARDSRIPLQALYPWLESVEYLEVQSGVNRVFWDASRLGDAEWNGAFLVYRAGIWEVHVGRDVFSDPDRIAVRGVRLNVGTISIWSAVDNPDFKNDLLSAFALRSVDIIWRDISQPAYLLTDPPPEGLPHLVLLDQLELLRLDSLLTSFRPVSSRFSEWKSSAAPVTGGPYPGPLAIDAYHPEAALLYLLAENPNLFDADGRLPAGLAALFDWAASSRKTDLVITDMPMSSLVTDNAEAAVRLPSSEEPLTVSETVLPLIDPPDGAVNIIRFQYAASPAGLSGEQVELTELVLADIDRVTRLRIPSGGVPLPMDPRIIRYYEAYERIGRLAISGQMNSSEAADLINDYITDKTDE